MAERMKCLGERNLCCCFRLGNRSVGEGIICRGISAVLQLAQELSSAMQESDGCYAEGGHDREECEQDVRCSRDGFTLDYIEFADWSFYLLL